MWTDTWVKKQGHPYSQEGGHRTTPHTTTSRVEAGSPHAPPWPLKVAVACWLSSGHCAVVLSPQQTQGLVCGANTSVRVMPGLWLDPQQSCRPMRLPPAGSFPRQARA